MWFLHVAGSGVWVNVGRTLHLPGARQLEAEGNRAAQKVVVLFFLHHRAERKGLYPHGQPGTRLHASRSVRTPPLALCWRTTFQTHYLSSKPFDVYVL